MNIETAAFTEIFTDLFYKTRMTKRQFALSVGIKHSQITNYLQGTLPTLNTVVKICDHFGCSIDYLAGLSDKFSYPNLSAGYNGNGFFYEYSRLLDRNKTTHFALSKQNLVCETRLSSWKRGALPDFKTLINIAYALGGSIDKMLGRINEKHS